MQHNIIFPHPPVPPAPYPKPRLQSRVPPPHPRPPRRLALLRPRQPPPVYPTTRTNAPLPGSQHSWSGWRTRGAAPAAPCSPRGRGTARLRRRRWFGYSCSAGAEMERNGGWRERAHRGGLGTQMTDKVQLGDYIQSGEADECVKCDYAENSVIKELWYYT